jgi:hypothetical protein
MSDSLNSDWLHSGLICLHCGLSLSIQLWTTTDSIRVGVESSSLMLQPTVSRPVCLGIKYPSGAYDQIFISLRQLRVCRCGTLSLTRGRVCRLQFLLVLASAVILRSESRGTRDHILLSQIRDIPFCRLLRLAGLRWRYSTPPPRGIDSIRIWVSCYIAYPYPRKRCLLHSDGLVFKNLFPQKRVHAVV